MSEKQTCPTCGELLQTCEECGAMGCPDNCNPGWSNKWWRDDPTLWLCPGCLENARYEYECATANGTKVCETCTMFKDKNDEGDGLCEIHQEPRHITNYCEDRIPADGCNTDLPF